MNRLRGTTSVVAVLLVMGLAAAVQPVLAGIDAECRQEAEDYGIVPELLDEYITGCIDSRGGPGMTDSTEDNPLEPVEPDGNSNPGTDSER